MRPSHLARTTCRHLFFREEPASERFIISMKLRGLSDPVHQDDEDAGSGSPSFGFNLDEVIKLEQQVLIPQLTDKVDDNYWLV